jgi:flagellar biosynthetic protein FliR
MEKFLQNWQIFLLIFLRVNSFLVTAPVIGSGQIPARAKVIFSLLLSILTYTLTPEKPLIVNDLPHFVPLILSEILTGLILGFLATLLFEVIRIAGEIMGMQGGFGIVSVMDPQSQQQISVISIFMFLLASLVFLVIGGGEALVRIIVESFFFLKLGQVSFSHFDPFSVTEYFSNLLKIALKIALPVMGFVFINYMVMGLFSRTAPRVQIFFIAFPLNMVLTLMILIFFMPYYFELMKEIFGIYFQEVDYFWKILLK